MRPYPFAHLRRAAAIVPLAIAAVVLALPLSVTLASPPGQPILPEEQEVVDLVNQERARKQLPPLVVNYSLQDAAWMHNEHMADTGCFCHDERCGQRACSDGTPGDRIAKTGYKPRTWGENIAWGQRTPVKVMEAWMGSPGHRGNILGSKYTDIGVAYNPNGPLWTQVFGAPREDYATVTPPAGAPGSPGPGPGELPPAACILPEDVTGDKRVNRLDVDLVQAHFLQTPEHPDWLPEADVMSDEVVNLFDIFQVVTAMGRTCP